MHVIVANKYKIFKRLRINVRDSNGEFIWFSQQNRLLIYLHWNVLLSGGGCGGVNRRGQRMALVTSKQNGQEVRVPALPAVLTDWQLQLPVMLPLCSQPHNYSCSKKSLALHNDIYTEHRMQTGNRLNAALEWKAQ